MAEHSPGPWLRAGHTVYALTTDKRGHVVNRFTALMQSARQPHEAQDDELMANAVLAQAAPDLLAAAEKGLLWVQWVAANHPDPGFSEPAARAAAEFEAAIDKARGS
jgi:hypothetical protein